MSLGLLKKTFFLLQLTFIGIFLQQVGSINAEFADAIVNVDARKAAQDYFDQQHKNSPNFLNSNVENGGFYNIFDYRNFQKRACIRRNESCDKRPEECCFNSSCRCNLWGSNCRCQHMGRFQKTI